MQKYLVGCPPSYVIYVYELLVSIRKKCNPGDYIIILKTTLFPFIYQISLRQLLRNENAFQFINRALLIFLI